MKNNTAVFHFFNDDTLKKNICQQLNYEPGELTIHHFPDKEIMVNINTDVTNKIVIFIVSTDKPNEKLTPLIFAAETARSLGAKKIGLITPYLAYMRQDKQFHPGEGISSIYFAKIISTYFDWIATIDPHMHRWHALNDIYTIPSLLLHATIPMAKWIKQNIHQPILIGPDKESEQWVSNIANQINAPYTIVEKTRFGDTHVESTIPDLKKHPNYTPVLIDDIISTAKTMIETIDHLKKSNKQIIYCVAVHAVFAENAYQELINTGVKDIATCNTITHPSNKIDLSKLIIDALKPFLRTLTP